ncbi:uncharacterized protein LOC117539871 [Gymnodraco acuticeps]|uniref:Uncharacterized protein LOC117539871 n=1 Tax=Gymnodraco acuticeps TaxID=8218 RepID=A0A6P8TUP7_GYMAC|nr:uncharacterized protein LOC117539871 [Gymnodraco acuticeps]
MASLSAFVDAPSVSFLDGCQKAQLIEISEHYEIAVVGSKRKDDIKAVIVSSLFERGVLQKSESGVAGVGPVVVQTAGLTFEQQKELLAMQFNQERLQLEMRGQQQEVEKRLEVEKVLEVEKMKCEVEHARLRLMGEGKFSPGEDGGARLASGSGDIISYLRLVPKFNERDPDIFFTLFEHIAEARNWSDSDRVLLLQCVLTGRAQEAYSAICGENTLDYDRVKSAVLKSYELVPEAYRQRFRSGVKGDKQTHVEFIRDLTSHFQRWCAAAKVASFDGLCELIVLEQFKNILPQRVATYVNEQKPPTAFRAAELADDFVLTHKGSFAEKYSRGDWKRGEDNGDARAKFSPGSSRRFAGTGRPEGAKVDQCHYCKGGGHWKEQCPLLETKGKPRLSPHAPAMCCSAVLVKKPQGVGSGMVPDKKLVCAYLDSRRMSTDLPVSESGKSGPTRSFDFQIETKVKEKKERKRRKAKKRRPKEVSAPKRPMSAYMLWLNASQPKEEWDIKAVESKKQYEIARQELEDRGGGGASSSPKMESKKLELRRRMWGCRGPLWGPVLREGL